MTVRNSLAVLGTSALLALGFGGAMAPTAAAAPPAAPQTAQVAADAHFTAKDSRSGRTTKGVAHKSGRYGAAAPSKAASLRCWNAGISGRYFAISCSGNAYRVFVDCSNRVRYVTPVLSGSKRVTMACPGGTRALRGGAYGR
ncbi:hypothetical protein MMF93_12100 [Streptomyces tubbatahanensis]|uniref:Secreted protein n=1 Tax=Streptomyces tubbatahanensis TaxID=2923272 RepID=A0ABY3XRX1_9ACTN|nr:hypothetical protein [Streptomyces tubbatahanensis]UNS97173.1 hypothetical protein MMF93_12100 [Streptomyces tubbatahanensis]